MDVVAPFVNQNPPSAGVKPSIIISAINGDRNNADDVKQISSVEKYATTTPKFEKYNTTAINGDGCDPHNDTGSYSVLPSIPDVKICNIL